jgi:hypothetical protein
VSADSRRYLVLDGFVPRLPEYDWIQVAHVHQGERASNLLVSAPMVRLIHPTEPDRTALVSKYFLAELAHEPRAE